MADICLMTHDCHMLILFVYYGKSVQNLSHLYYMYETEFCLSAPTDISAHRNKRFTFTSHIFTVNISIFQNKTRAFPYLHTYLLTYLLVVQGII